MADSTTTNYGWAYPTINADADTWGTTLNNAIIAVDAALKAVENAAPKKASNLGDLNNAGTARTNLGLGSAATQPSTAFVTAGTALLTTNNLSEPALDKQTARENLGVRVGTIKIFVAGTDPSAFALANDIWLG